MDSGTEYLAKCVAARIRQRERAKARKNVLLTAAQIVGIAALGAAFYYIATGGAFEVTRVLLRAGIMG